jgi:Fe-S cluster assembly protein SufD
MSALLDSLASAFHGDAQRKVALDAALRGGLPGPRSEAWKYTSLRALERRAFAVPEASAVAGFDASLLPDIPAPRLVFVNGRHAPAHSDIAGLPAGVVLEIRDDMSAPTATDAVPDGDDVFARLNAALADTGVVLHVDPGIAVASVVHLVFIGMPAQEDLAWHLRHQIVLGEGASLSLVEHHVASGAHRHLDNSRVDIQLHARARLDHARMQHDADGATRFLRTDAVLADAAHYTRIDVELGSALSRHELAVRLEGKDARLNANGVLLANGRRHLDTRLAIEHIARDTTCDLLWRGIGADRGRAVFHGGITIQPGADGSDARLSNKNLLLSEQAEIDTQPVLVIHADEVQAAHGATVGQLDPTAMFYLRSRGLPEAQARRLLTTAFSREPLLAITSPQVRELLQARLDAALGAIEGA